MLIIIRSSCDIDSNSSNNIIDSNDHDDEKNENNNNSKSNKGRNIQAFSQCHNNNIMLFKCRVFSTQEVFQFLEQLVPWSVQCIK